MREVGLSTPGVVALVDDEDWDLVSRYRWHFVKNRYAQANVRDESTGKKAALRMHKLLMPGIPLVEHRDRNGLNNQKNNLRPATQSQNLANTEGFPSVRKARFKGVRKTAHGRWQAR